jgi:hypothetical protein
MRRLQDYLRFLVWNCGLGYIALWAITFWTLDHSKTVLGLWGGCSPDPNTVLFYWVCDSASPYSILANIANSALTITIWAPVYVAGIAERPEAAALLVPIITTHLVGLATAILVTIRLMLAFFQLVRRLSGRTRAPTVTPAAATGPAATTTVTAAAPTPPAAIPRLPAPRRARPHIPPRTTFGLRPSTRAK